MRYLFFLAGHGLGRAFSRTGIGLGPLTVDGKSPSMPKSAIAAKVHETLDVHGNLPAHISFDFDALVDVIANPGYFRLGKILCPGVEINAGAGQYRL